MQLAYENGHAAQRTDRLSRVYPFCAEIGPSYNQGLALATVMHVLSVEVWVILKVIVLRTKVPRVGKQAVPQEFVPSTERATTRLGCASLNQAFWAARCREMREGVTPRPRLT